MTFRRFDLALEELASAWRGTVESKDAWVDKGPFGASESHPIQVELNGLRAIAKPGLEKPDQIARAAHEKIASDLAYDLGLPVPPVVLWDRGNIAAPAARHVAISAWAFPQPMTWDQAAQKLPEDVKLEAGPAVSAMRAFETWIAADDRKSDHTLVAWDGPGHPLQIAFIDYAFSMSYRWKAPNDPAGAAGHYMPVPVDHEVVRLMAGKIASLPTQTISDIVRRVPNAYLTDSQREAIVNNLTSRAPQVLKMLGLS